ncbi:hypothetical protein V6N12_001323 [Hibiscus sabdariffa]
MRGVVWLDRGVKNGTDDHLFPPRRVSGDTSKFKYNNPKGDRSAIRISRIVSETLRLGMEDVRWFVMGDDDTFFVPDNLVRVLSKYDHNQFYYIGSSSESHLQNINFSYGMAYGGGGFAISYPLAKALAKMQDRCIQRYPGLYGSDDRIHACMAELGVPLSKEHGFHQYDVFGNLLGLLSAHPVAPLVSIHHLDKVEPIFPNVNRVQALKRLDLPIDLDSAALMQQSVCYDKTRSWTVSVSWGYTVQIYRGIFSVREMEMPARTFLNWYKRADYTGFSFNTRPVTRHVCQKPFVYYLSKASRNKKTNQTTCEHVRHRVPNPDCMWKMPDPSRIDRVEVYRKPDPNLWDKSPRRNCCRVLPTKKKGTMFIDVGECGDDETKNASIPNVNLTWEFPVIEDYKYLVRMHFCDIASIPLGLLFFNVYVNGHLAYKDLDLSAITNYVLASPYYADFAVDADRSGVVSVSVGPSSKSMAYTVDAILNGVEIMRMNNSVGSLDGKLPAEQLFKCWWRRIVGILLPLIALVCLLLSFSAIMHRTKNNAATVPWSKLPMDDHEVSKHRHINIVKIQIPTLLALCSNYYKKLV